MKKPWNLPSYPVYSLITEDSTGRKNMNIMTYVIPVSMQPKHYIIALYHGTCTLKNWQEKHHGILQILALEHSSVISVLGKKSGKSYDKIKYLAKKGLLADTGFLSSIAGYIELEEIEKLLDGGGDHVLYLCRVTSSKSYHESVLSTGILVAENIIL